MCRAGGSRCVPSPISVSGLVGYCGLLGRALTFRRRLRTGLAPVRVTTTVRRQSDLSQQSDDMALRNKSPHKTI
jgi:hypothetical protein